MTTDAYHLTTDEIERRVFKLSAEINDLIERMRRAERGGNLVEAERLFHQARTPIERRNLLRDELDSRRRAAAGASRPLPPRLAHASRVLSRG